MTAVDGFQAELGTALSFLASQVSYRCDLTGPSMTVQTACSSSLVAVHLAYMALLGGECDVAIAGGVSIELPLVGGHRYRDGMIYSPDGHCRAFDADAQGTVAGDGLACVVLKRLQDAVAAGDDVYAVIRGTAVGNDGSQKIGFTAPGVRGQVAALRAAHAAAGISPETIDYIEAHGTGTRLGDPIELTALAEVLAPATRSRPVLVGSVKSNIGHLDAAAGIASLVKTALALRHRQIPATLHVRRPNPDFQSPGAFEFPAVLSSWERAGHPRRAGVSSFGIGGTNAHVVLEEYDRPAATRSAPPHLLTLTARTPGALGFMAGNLASWLDDHEDADLGDVAFTLQTGRSEFSWRRAIVCEDLAGKPAVTRLLTQPPGTQDCWQDECGEPDIAFVFAGQGIQRPEAVAELCRDEPFFAREVGRLVEHARRSGADLAGCLLGGPGEAGAAASQPDRPDLAQPALFVHEYALARLWQRWGIEPAAMLGNSLGEYTAACLAGVFSPEDALDLLIIRGRLCAERCEPGVMTAVAAAPEEIAHLLGEKDSVAVRVAPGRCVVAGAAGSVARLEQALEARNVNTRRLGVSRAYHSALMRPMCEEFAAAAARRIGGQPGLPFISGVSGTWITAAQAADPGYWAYEHVLRPVRYGDGIRELCGLAEPALLGIGPYEGLPGTVALNLDPGQKPPRVVSSFPPPARSMTVGVSMASALGHLWTAGARVDWTVVHDGRHRRKLHLPTYPFQRERYWAGDSACGRTAGRPQAPDAAPGKAPGPVDIPDRGPDDEIERTVLAVFSEVLGETNASPAASFYDLGGDSLTATQVVARIREVFEVEMPLRAFFGDPTATAISAAIRRQLAGQEQAGPER